MGLILNIRIKMYRWQSRNLTNCGNDVAVYIYTCMNKERKWRYTYEGEKFEKRTDKFRGEIGTDILCHLTIELVQLYRFDQLIFCRFYDLRQQKQTRRKYRIPKLIFVGGEIRTIDNWSSIVVMMSPYTYIHVWIKKESDDILTREKNSKKGQTNSTCKIEIEIK
jgi:hypothetical protein